MGLETALLAGALVSAGGSVYGGYAQGKAATAQSRYERGRMAFNAEVAERQAADALASGEEEASIRRARTRRAIGAARAGFASQGISVDVGSAASYIEDTRHIGELDVLAIRNNATREAFGFKVQALGYQGAAGMSRLAARNVRDNAMLGGVLGATREGVQYGYNRARYFDSPAPRQSGVSDRQSLQYAYQANRAFR